TGPGATIGGCVEPDVTPTGPDVPVEGDAVPVEPADAPGVPTGGCGVAPDAPVAASAKKWEKTSARLGCNSTGSVPRTNRGIQSDPSARLAGPLPLSWRRT